MNYYVYRISPQKHLEYIDEFESYRKARSFVRTMRSELPKDDDCTIRMILAPDREQAERLLKEPRKARPLGEDA